MCSCHLFIVTICDIEPSVASVLPNLCLSLSVFTAMFWMVNVQIELAIISCLAASHLLSVSICHCVTVRRYINNV